MNRLRLGMLSVAGLVAWVGCSSAGSNDTGGSGGGPSTGGGVGVGGLPGNTGGLPSGSGGVATGTGGVATGTGGVATGTGGVATGTGGVATGTGGGSTTVECTGAATMSGYMDNGTLCGYAWTASNGEGETIEPPCGSAGPCFMDTICADGSLPPNDPDASVYTGVMIGWNVAQANGASSTQTWTATGTGLTFNFTVPASATGEVRVMIQSGGTDYCAPAATSGAPLTWSDFTVDCWEAGGTAFTAGSPITAVALQLNGSDAEQTFTGLCLDGVTVN